MAKSKVKKYYAVAAGKKPGIYETWEECKNQVYGCYAKYKSFLKLEEAQAFMNKYGTDM